MAILARRGFRPLANRSVLPVPATSGDTASSAVIALLGHYAFRLFVRGALQKADRFFPGETTRYLKASQARSYSQSLVKLGLAARISGGCYRLVFLITP